MTQLTPIKGFSNTPISRSICIVTTLLALGLSIFQYKYVVGLNIDPFITEYLQFWRILTYQLSVINESDYLLCVLLFFQFKALERFYGSRKYLSLIVLFGLYNSILCLSLMMVGQITVNRVLYFVKYVFQGAKAEMVYHETWFNQIEPGPLGILSSLYFCYGSVIPVSYRFVIMIAKPSPSEEQELAHDSDGVARSSKNLQLNNHFQLHINYILLFLNNGFKSMIPCIVGLLVGKLYKEELLPGAKHLMLPQSVLGLISNPYKFMMGSFSYRFGRDGSYQRLNTGDSETNWRSNELGNDDDSQEVLDDTNPNNGRNEIRAETPVRPLGSQFLDTFRT